LWVNLIIFVNMLNFNKICFLFIILLTAFLNESCKDSASYRYISDTDTTFTKDIRDISKKINAQPKEAELFYKRAKTFYFEEKIKDALIDIDYAMELDSINPLYCFTKGKYLMSGDTADAVAAEFCYKKAIRLRPDYVEAYFDLAKIQFAKQAYNDAQENYFKASKLDPSNPIPYFYLGLMAKEQKDTAKSIELFEKTLVYDGNYYDAVVQLGNYYAEKNDKKCLILFDRALKLNEYSAEVMYAKGLYLQKQNAYRDAAILYEQVSKIDPGHFFARYNLAFINANFSNYEKALKLLDEVLSLKKEYPEALTLRGFVKEKMNNSLGAYSDYQAALQLDKNQKLAIEGLKRVKVVTSF